MSHNTALSRALDRRLLLRSAIGTAAVAAVGGGVTTAQAAPKRAVAKSVRVLASGRTRKKRQSYDVWRIAFGNDFAHITAPRNRRPGTRVRGVLYVHGAGGRSDDFATSAKWRDLREGILETGGIVAECGGIGSYATSAQAGAHNWGKAYSQSAYNELAELVESRYQVSSWIVIGRSMGGINGKYLATRDPRVAPKCVAYIDNAAVYDLLWFHDNNMLGLRRTYAALDRDHFLQRTEYVDPARQPVELWRGKHVLTVVGTKDTSVPRASQGSRFRLDTARVVGRHSRHVVLSGRDHGVANGTFQTGHMLSFIRRVWGLA